MRLVDHHPCRYAGRVEDQLVSSDPGIQAVALSEAEQYAVRYMEIDHTESSHSLSLTVVELGVASVRSLATGRVAGTLNKRNHHVNSCYLYGWLVLESMQHKTTITILKGSKLHFVNLHSGLFSSHFFLRLRHVMHPVFVRLLKFRFRFFGSDCADISLLS